MPRSEETIKELLEIGSLMPNHFEPMMHDDLLPDQPVDGDEEHHRPCHRHRTDQLHRPMPTRCFGN
jgi:hypothetical protein